MASEETEATQHEGSLRGGTGVEVMIEEWGRGVSAHILITTAFRPLRASSTLCWTLTSSNLYKAVYELCSSK